MSCSLHLMSKPERIGQYQCHCDLMASMIPASLDLTPNYIGELIFMNLLCSKGVYTVHPMGDSVLVP